MSEEVEIPEQPNKKNRKRYNDPISVAKRTNQKVHFVAQHDKISMLELICKNSSDKHSVIIVKTKRSADELSNYLKEKNFKATSIHGNHRAQELEATAKAFNIGEIDILITTDMILKALNLSNIEQIISYELPIQPEDYFDRLCFVNEASDAISLVSPEEENFLSTIEVVMKFDIPQEEVQGFTHTQISQNELLEPVKKQKTKPRHSKQKKRAINKAES